ncbi:MAG: CRISPR-associated protein Csx15 [Anaerolineae bacterium]
MNILNFAHPLTEAQRQQIEALIGRAITAVTDVRVQFDLSQPFGTQVVAMLDALGIDSAAWQTQNWLLVLPSLNYIAASLLAELHGRTGHFPAIIRLRPTENTFVTEFEVAEIINLEQIRAAARNRR